MIILDACRYDYYHKYRNAEKAIARDTITIRSIPKMFPYRYSHTYVSANPEVNGTHFKTMFDYDPTKHFAEVIDVWDFGWDTELETVHPSTVCETAFRLQKKGLKTVIHFMQPHPPFIGEVTYDVPLLSWYDARQKVLGLKKRKTHHHPTQSGMEKLKNAYDTNLRLVLEYAVKCINGRTLTTSDHGDLLGEVIGGRMRWGHYSPSTHPKLLEVPWEMIG